MTDDIIKKVIRKRKRGGKRKKRGGSRSRNRNQRPNNFRGIAIGLVIVSFLSLFTILVMISHHNKTPSINLTLKKYNRIQTGMSYTEVTNIIGYDGTEMSRNKMDAIPGFSNEVITIMYMWQNNNGSNMNAIFQNDKLVQKAQFGLN
jgi:hypothetical protein